MRIKRLFQRRLLATSLAVAFAAAGLQAGKLKVTLESKSGEEGELGGMMTRSMGATAHVPPVAPGGYDVRFNRILNNQTQSGRDVFLLATNAGAAGPANEFAIARVLQTVDAATGRIGLAARGVAQRLPAVINGVANTAGAAAFVNPLYAAAIGAEPAYGTILNGNIVAVSPDANFNTTLLVSPIADPTQLISTAFAPALAPGATVTNAARFTALKDALGVATGSIRGLLAGKDAAFAAVAQGADFFADNADARGVAKVVLTGNQLAQSKINTAAGAAADSAAPLSITPTDFADPASVGAVFNSATSRLIGRIFAETAASTGAGENSQQLAARIQAIPALPAAVAAVAAAAAGAAAVGATAGRAPVAAACAAAIPGIPLVTAYLYAVIAAAVADNNNPNQGQVQAGIAAVDAANLAAVGVLDGMIPGPGGGGNIAALAAVTAATAALAGAAANGPAAIAAAINGILNIDPALGALATAASVVIAPPATAVSVAAAVGVRARANTSDMVNAAFTGTGAPLAAGPVPDGTGVVMHYDADLNRVFVGLKGLRKNVDSIAGGLPFIQEGGLVGVLVGVPGDLDGAPVGSLGGLNFRSVVHNPTPDLFGGVGVANRTNRRDGIIAMYHGPELGNAVPRSNQVRQDRDVYVSVHHLKTMRTSTGRTYLIVASEIGALNPGAVSTSGVFFVPIMGNNDLTLAKNKATREQVGKVARPDFTGILSGGAVDVAAPADRSAVAVRSATNSYAELPVASANCITNTLEILDNGASRVRKIQVNARDIRALEVVGDSVFMVINNDEIDGGLEGAYQTTALFDNAGNIKGWTPLQRVSGIKEKATAIAIDNVSGNAMYIDAATGTTLRISDWATNSAASAELSNLISQHFPANRGGVRAIHTFDSNTPTFSGGLINNAAPIAALHQYDKKCSLLVILGYDKAMVVQTAFMGKAAQHFRASAAVPGTPVANMTFGALGALAAPVVNSDIQNVFVFDSATNPDLKKIAPLSCAEVLKVVPEVGGRRLNGYIYVGGLGGVCRLQGTAAGGLGIGSGWETRAAAAPFAVTGLADFAGFFGDASNPRFVKLDNNNLKDIRKIISTLGSPANAADSTRLIALMEDGYVVATGAQLDLAGLPKTALGLNTTLAFDMALVKEAAAAGIVGGVPGLGAGIAGAAAAAVNANSCYAVIATEQGLLVQHLAAAGNNALVRLDEDDLPLQVVYEARDRGGVTGGGARNLGGAGMLYVLAGSQAKGKIRVYRFEVRFDAAAGNVLTKRDGAPTVIDLPTFRRYFGTDGLQFLFGHDMALDTGEMLNQVMLSSATASPLPVTWALGNVGLGSFMAGAPVREATTGAWMVPGSFGLKVND